MPSSSVDQRRAVVARLTWSLSLSVLARASSVSCVLYGESGDSGDFGLIASGKIDEKALITCASKVIEGRGGMPSVTTIGSFRTVRDTSLSEGGGEIAVRDGGPLLLGAGSYLRAMIDTAEKLGLRNRYQLHRVLKKLGLP